MHANGVMRATLKTRDIDEDMFVDPDIPFVENVNDPYQEGNGAIYKPGDYGVYQKKYTYIDDSNALQVTKLDNSASCEIQNILGLTYSGGNATDKIFLSYLFRYYVK